MTNKYHVIVEYVTKHDVEYNFPAKSEEEAKEFALFLFSEAARPNCVEPKVVELKIV